MTTESTAKDQSGNASFVGMVYPVLIGFGIVCAVVACFFTAASSVSIAIVSAGALIGSGLLALTHAVINRP